MEFITDIFSYVGRTNLFNFAIFVIVIAFIAKKIDVSGRIEAAKNNVIRNIEDSSKEKADSEIELQKIMDSVAHIEDEVDEILKKAENSANVVGGNVLEEAGKITENIRENSQKMLATRTALLKNDIVRRASEASINVARQNIINELLSNPDLHNKLIDESLEAINGVKI